MIYPRERLMWIGIKCVVLTGGVTLSPGIKQGVVCRTVRRENVALGHTGIYQDAGVHTTCRRCEKNGFGLLLGE